MDKKDEIILQQLEVIRAMTENNLRSMSGDFWGGAPSAADEGSPSDKLLSILEEEDSKAEPAFQKKEAAKAETKAKPEEPEETLEDLKKELEGYVGLETVKEEVKDLINLAVIYQKRRESQLPTADMSFHMVFSGNPGTGKTMIARLMARVYKVLGILSKGQLVEVDRSGLVAGYVGQTALKTSEVIEKAKGGVLFIDEAYALTNKEGNDFGQEAVDTLLKAMEDHREDLIVIVAGYEGLMEEFIHSNPGLESRFNRYLHFDDYTPEEMLGIFQLNCEKSAYTLAEDAEEPLKTLLSALSLKGGITFGNGRGVRNVFERILTEQANRLAAKTEPLSREDLMQLTKDDVIACFQEMTKGELLPEEFQKIQDDLEGKAE